MDCQYAYLDPPNEHILCRRETPPVFGDKASYFHALCSCQEFCPAKNCHKLSPDWGECMKRKEDSTAPAVKTAAKRKSESRK